MVAEVKMYDGGIRSGHIGGTAHVRCLVDKAGDARLRWFEALQRRNGERISGGGMLRSELPGRRPGGGAKRRFMDAVKVDVELIGVRKKKIRRVRTGCDGSR